MENLTKYSALIGILFLTIAGILNASNGGDWKYTFLAILYAVGNIIIFVLP